MNNPKISVIIPVYNVEQYLRECLDSVVNQTFRDLEIICVNDGSTDGSLAILEEYAAKDSRIVVMNQENAGQSSARNKALDIAKGDYILFVDSDDVIDLATVEKTYPLALESDSDLIMFYVSQYESSSNSLLDSPVREQDDTLYRINMAFFQYPVIMKCLWKKRLIDRINLRFHEGIKFEDVPFVLIGALKSNRITLLPETLYYFQVNNNSTTRVTNSYYCNYSWLAFTLAMEDIKDINLSEECLKCIIRHKLRLIWIGYINHTPSDLLRLFRKNIKNSIFPNEYKWLKNNQIELSNPQRLFFLSIYGDWITRCIANIKIAKYKLADRIVHFLIPHSPLLQSMIEKAKQGQANE